MTADAPQLAERNTRLVAVSVDGIIGMLIFVPALMGFVPALVARYINGEPLQFAAGLLLGLQISGLLLLLVGVINLILVARNSQTIGKKLLGIKVVRKDGSRASLGRIFWLRNAVPFVFGLVPILGFVWPIADALMIYGEERQCLHDKLADTIVVRA